MCYMQAISSAARASPPSPTCTSMPGECHRFSHSKFRPCCTHRVELATYPPDVLSRHAFKLGHVFKVIIPCLTREIDNLLGQHSVVAVCSRNSVSSSGDLAPFLFICW